MKELKNLTESQRIQVTIQCESFFISYKRGKELKAVYDTLSSISSHRSTKEVWLVITAAVKSSINNTRGVLLPLRKPAWLSANKITGQALSLTRMKSLLEVLEHHGYLEVYKGYRDVDRDQSYTSCILFTDKMFDLLPDNIPKKLVQRRDPKSLIEIKKEGEVLTSTRGFKGVAVLREELQQINDLLSATDIRLGVTKCSVEYKRVFSSDTCTGGRFYSFGSFQTLPSRLRETFRINGDSVTECDLSQLHPSTLRCWEDIPYDPSFKAYHVPKDQFDIDLDDKQWRTLCKHGLLYMINAKSRSSAANSLFNKLHRKPDRVLQCEWEESVHRKFGMYPSQAPDKKTIFSILQRLEEHNHEIHHRFYEDMLWAKLQHADSEMSRYVMMKFVRLGIPILPYHDSYVCQKKHRKLLIATMYEAWEHVMKTKDHCKVDVKF